LQLNFTTSDNLKSCKFQASTTWNTRLQNQHREKGCKQRETSRTPSPGAWHHLRPSRPRYLQVIGAQTLLTHLKS